MSHPPDSPQVRRVVLVPASGRDDELVRRYRLARVRLARREAPERAVPTDRRAGTLGSWRT